ncbi:MAG: hypothetical protein M1829_000399 [Trizodia sp. TS-e1964]|nr:MAG: hypothetical protein M1829_000399 [Trizodia sp. TS-e1964]
MSAIAMEMSAALHHQQHASLDQHTALPSEMHSYHDAHHVRGRKYSSTGGGRAWTEDEEVYLLQTRLQKMPYKHIASHLRKTELACRLHYHQLSHGSNRRKRTASLSSASSDHSPHHTRPHSPPERDDLAGLLGHGMKHHRSPPTRLSPISPVNGHGAVQKPGPNSPHRSQKPLLPRPHVSAAVSARRLAESNKGLRLDCSGRSSPKLPSIDKDRLCRIYETHRSSFWKVIAADYGDNANPLYLEEVWKKEATRALPTPGVSPDHSTSLLGPSAFLPFDHNTLSEIGRGFSPINTLNPIRSSSFSRTERDAQFSLPTPLQSASTPSTASSSGSYASPSAPSAPNAPSMSSSSSTSVPATAISALLGQDVEVRRNSDVPMRDASY